MIATILFCVLIPSFVLGEVVVFDKYDTTMEYDDGVLTVTKQLRLKNVGNNPIIPGEIHFKISQEDKDATSAPVISSFKVTNKFDKELETRQVSSNNEVDLVFTVWDPLLPDFFYDMTMSYDLEFKPSGVLFYHVALPEEKTTIPIKKSSTTFLLPNNYHVTYAPGGEISSEKSLKEITWEVKDAYQVEYSVIPFPKMGFRAVNIFWVLIILLFLIHLFFRLKKKARMAG